MVLFHHGFHPYELSQPDHHGFSSTSPRSLTQRSWKCKKAAEPREGDYAKVNTRSFSKIVMNDDYFPTVNQSLGMLQLT